MDAAALTPGIIDHLMIRFNAVLAANTGPMLTEAMWLLKQFATWHLALSSLGLMAGVSLRGIMAHIVVTGLKITVFVYLLTNLGQITTAFANTMVQYGILLGGSQITADEFQRPGEMVANGMRGLKPLFTYLENLGTWEKLTNMWVVMLYGGIAWICLLCYIMIGAHLVLALIEFKIVAAWSLVMLPWGLVSHTAFIAEGAIGGLVSSAVRLGVLAFVMSLIAPLITALALPATVLDGTDLAYWHALSSMAGAALMLVVSWVVPNYAASLMGSGPALTGQTLIGMGAGAAGGIARAGMRLAA